MSKNRIVGIIPAGGVASRLSPISGSKEVFPVGWHRDSMVPKVMGNYLIDYFKSGGADQIFCVIKEGKWDIPAYFKDGKSTDTNIAYLISDLPYGVPFTVNQVRPFLKGEIILFGFPDIIIEPEDAFKKIVDQYDEGDADVVLGAFKVENFQKWDLVSMDDTGDVVDIHIKPKTRTSDFAWAIGCWGERFTELINDFCLETMEQIQQDASHLRDFHMGDCLKAGLAKGLKIEVVTFENGSSIDLGTLKDLHAKVKENATTS